jgi:hypothetical protein
MLRKLLIVATLAATAGLFVFWFVTNPVMVSASALPPYAPNHAKRQGHVFRRRLQLVPCESRPGRPQQAGRRPRAAIAVRHLLRAQHLVRSQ